jgi:1-acyl-sn-glycerol-3-phosphate acyltransferase
MLKIFLGRLLILLYKSLRIRKGKKKAMLKKFLRRLLTSLRKALIKRNEKTMLKKFLSWLLILLYKVEITGLDNYTNAGKRVLIIANHTSFLDPLLLGVFLPDDITFAISTQMSQRWWLKPFLRLSRVFPMDPTHPISLKDLIHYLENDSKTVIFPEGRISVTGSLMKIYIGCPIYAFFKTAQNCPFTFLSENHHSNFTA